MCKDDCVGIECGKSLHLKASCGVCPDGFGCTGGMCQPDGMIRIPEGAFWMGCDDAHVSFCASYEKPYHEVTLSEYFIDRTEVTTLAYKKCMDSGGCEAPTELPAWSYSSADAAKPMAWVTSYEAGQYCRWMGKRLPTEAEWEKAARGTDGRTYPWGEADESALGYPTCDQAVFYDGSLGCGTGGAMNVCSKSPAGDSPYGLCDMAGNISEWVSDFYVEGYYEDGPSMNPQGAASGSARIRRGGSFESGHGNSQQDCAVFSRYIYTSPSGVGWDIGFRCAWSKD